MYIHSTISHNWIHAPFCFKELVSVESSVVSEIGDGLSAASAYLYGKVSIALLMSSRDSIRLDLKKFKHLLHLILQHTFKISCIISIGSPSVT